MIFGVGRGLFAGYVVPKTLHYGWGSSHTVDSTEQHGPSAILVPAFAPDRVGLVLMGSM